MEITIDSVVILGNGNLQITYTYDSVQDVKEVTKEKLKNILEGITMGS